jgi:hypothetical protein
LEHEKGQVERFLDVYARHFDIHQVEDASLAEKFMSIICHHDQCLTVLKAEVKKPKYGSFFYHSEKNKQDKPSMELTYYTPH